MKVYHVIATGDHITGKQQISFIVVCDGPPEEVILNQFDIGGLRNKEWKIEELSVPCAMQTGGMLTALHKK